MNYYNEFDPKAAAWLRVLISEQLIPDGIVDERSIRDVRPADLDGFTQCHFFAGIGGWPLALQLAGWRAGRPVWTGSCPCQPFSTAGKGLAQADERHLWLEFFRLIRQRRPDTVFGEQVESAIGHGWLDGISADLEGEGYAVGAAVLGAHSVGAPHKRQRLYWVADYQGQGRSGMESERASGQQQRPRVGGGGAVDRVADTKHSPGRAEHVSESRGWEAEGPDHAAECGGNHGLVIADSSGREPGQLAAAYGHEPGRDGAGAVGPTAATGPWSDFQIIQCRDGKARRIPAQSESVFQRMAYELSAELDALRDISLCEEDIQEIAQAMTGFPLAGKMPARVALLKGMGNAIVPSLAAEFIKSFMGVCKLRPSSSKH